MSLIAKVCVRLTGGLAPLPCENPAVIVFECCFSVCVSTLAPSCVLWMRPHVSLVSAESEMVAASSYCKALLLDLTSPACYVVLIHRMLNYSWLSSFCGELLM